MGEKQRNSSQDLVERVHVMRKFFTNKETWVQVKMSFSKVPMKNPGRYFETFVKIVEPIGGQAQNTAFCSQSAPPANLWTGGLTVRKENVETNTGNHWLTGNNSNNNSNNSYNSK